MNHLQPGVRWGAVLVIIALITTGLFAGCTNRLNATVALAAQERPVPDGDPEQGKQALARYGCGACHTVAGVPGARGLVGPPLTGIGERAYIAGVLANTPNNMVIWIMNPQVIVPGNAMPNLDVSEADARDMVAYLYTTQAETFLNRQQP